MSESVKCEHCKKVGRRPRMHPAPEGWLYLEAVDDDEDVDADGQPMDCLIVYACSTECALAQWKKGPGPRFSGLVD